MSHGFLRCPECHSLFRIPLDVVSGVGLDVRCSSCGHEWFARKTDIEPEAGEQDSLPDEQPELDEPEEEAEEPAEEIDDDLAAAFERLSPEEQSPTQPAHDKQSDPSGKGWRRFILIALLLLNIVAVVAAASLALVVFKERIVTMMPAAKPLYEMIGYGDSTQLALADISYSRNRSGQSWRYVLKGAVVNEGEEGMPMPQIRVRLVSETGEVLQTWQLTKEGAEGLPPGERRAFRARNLRSTDKAAEMLVVDIGTPVELDLRNK